MADPTVPPTPADVVVVLVAEDEVLIRLMAVEALVTAGFVVLEAEHAEAALSLLSTGATGVHALFTDIHMPGDMDGLRLAHHVRKHWPWIALLLASGKARPPPEMLPVGSRFVTKPYETEHVVSHVRELVLAA